MSEQFCTRERKRVSLASSSSVRPALSNARVTYAASCCRIAPVASASTEPSGRDSTNAPRNRSWLTSGTTRDSDPSGRGDSNPPLSAEKLRVANGTARDRLARTASGSACSGNGRPAVPCSSMSTSCSSSTTAKATR